MPNEAKDLVLLDDSLRIGTDRKNGAATAAPGPITQSHYSSAKMFFFAQISFRIFGHTVTLTSPRCAFRRSSINVRDCPIPPPIESGI